MFIRWIGEGEQERDGDGLWLCGGDAVGEVAQFFRARRGEDFSVGGGAFVDAEAEVFGDQRLDAIEEEVVEFGAGLASDFDGVFETCVVTSAVRAPFRSSSVLVPTVVPWRRMKFSSWRDLFYRFEDGLGGIGGRRKNFQHFQAMRFRIDPDAVGEGAAGVDGDAEGLGRVGHGGVRRIRVTSDGFPCLAKSV